MGEVIGISENGDNKDYSAAGKLIEAVEAEQAKIDEINAKAMDEKAPFRDEIAAVKKRIKEEHGIEAKSVNTILAKRRQERRMEARIAGLDEQQKAQFDQLEMAV